MVLQRVRTFWHSLSDETRVGLASGVVLSLLLAGVVALHRETALGLSVLQSGVQAGTVTADVLGELRRGVVFLYPGFFVGVGVTIWWYARRGMPPSRRSRVVLLATLTFVPVATTVVLGFAGALAVVGTLLVDGGVLTAVVMGFFFGGLVFAVALGGATFLFVGTVFSAGIGLTVGYGLTALAGR